MEENSTPTPEVPTPHFDVQPQPESKIKTSLLVMMSFLVIVSTALAGFFAYQTQKLAKQLTELSVAQISPSPTTYATPDPTADWKTYTNQKYGYSFRYPSDWNLRGVAGSQTEPGLADSFFLEGPYQNVETLAGVPEFTIKVYVTDNQSSSQTSEQVINSKSISNNKYVTFNMTLYNPTGPLNSTVLVEILSTFKLEYQTSLPSPSNKSAVCTQEAKLCPDGSYVGRTGPNCEFAACPTPSN